jgi:hypothetical protein
VNESQAPYTRTSEDGKGVNTKQLLLDSWGWTNASSEAKVEAEDSCEQLCGVGPRKPQSLYFRKYFKCGALSQLRNCIT